MSYQVFVDDNFYYMDKQHRYLLDEFETLGYTRSTSCSADRARGL
jgi:hypothetical protein